MEVEYRRQQLTKAFHSTFTSTEGKLVLEALKSEYYDMPLNGIPLTGEQALRVIGNRDVIEHILEILNEQADNNE